MPPRDAPTPGLNRFVAVKGDCRGCGDDPAATAEVEQALERRFERSARHELLDHLAWAGLVLWMLALLPIVLAKGAGITSATPWLASVPALVVGGLLLAATSWRTLRPHAAALLLAAALVLAAAPWLATGTTAAASTPTALWLLVLGNVWAVSLASWRAVAALGGLMSLSACLMLAAGADAPLAIAAVLATLISAGAVWLRHRLWRRQVRQAVDTEQRHQAIRDERDGAMRTDAEKSRFLAIASHDLRQPVHALGLFAATLQRRLQSTPEEPLVRNLVRAVDGLERSFNALLDISRLDAGGVAPRVETFALRDMFRRLHMHYAGQAELAGLGLRFSPGGKSVTSDPQLLERIVGNLIQNAIKYTNEGGIVVVARNATDHINVEIWDTGCGIAPKELPRIFDEFYQVGRAERDRAHGLGMGLAIVKRLASLMGHRLEVASTPGRGTMFRIGVPLGSLPGIQEDLAPADTQPMPLESPRMVLVVDDEEPIREGLRLLLEEWGYHVTTAANASQAQQVATALEGRIDLVISDLHLGDGPDGTEVIASVRRLCGRTVPALLITGDTSQEQLAPVIASGDPVLFKPVQPRRLFAALHDTML